jgi:hypothetical protein
LRQLRVGEIDGWGLFQGPLGCTRLRRFRIC